MKCDIEERLLMQEQLDASGLRERIRKIQFTILVPIILLFLFLFCVFIVSEHSTPEIVLPACKSIAQLSLGEWKNGKWTPHGCSYIPFMENQMALRKCLTGIRIGFYGHSTMSVSDQKRLTRKLYKTVLICKNMNEHES